MVMGSLIKGIKEWYINKIIKTTLKDLTQFKNNRLTNNRN